MYITKNNLSNFNLSKKSRNLNLELESNTHNDVQIKERLFSYPKNYFLTFKGDSTKENQWLKEIKIGAVRKKELGIKISELEINKSQNGSSSKEKAEVHLNGEHYTPQEDENPKNERDGRLSIITQKDGPVALLDYKIVSNQPYPGDMKTDDIQENYNKFFHLKENSFENNNFKKRDYLVVHNFKNLADIESKPYKYNGAGLVLAQTLAKIANHTKNICGILIYAKNLHDTKKPATAMYLRMGFTPMLQDKKQLEEYRKTNGHWPEATAMYTPLYKDNENKMPRLMSEVIDKKLIDEELIPNLKK